MAKILAVDNDLIALEICKTLFSAGGFEIQTAADAASAITKYQQTGPDIILLNVDMPDGGGVKVFEKLNNKIGQLVPIVFSSARPEQFPLLLARPFSVMLKRPVSADSLSAGVKKLIAGMAPRPPAPPSAEKVKILAVDDDLCILEIYKEIFTKAGFDIQTAEDASSAVSKFQAFKPALLILGKVGVHKDDGLDIGSNTENLLRLAPCHVLLTTRKFVPPLDEVARHTISWTKEAEARMERVPSFVKNMARMAILRYAQDKGHTVISTSIVDEAMNVLMPRAAMEAMSGGGMKSDTGARHMPGMGAPGPSVDDERILWEEDALKELQKIEDLSVREQIRLRTEKLVRIKGVRRVLKGDVMV